MLANTDERDFTTLSVQFRELVSALVDSVGMPAISLDVEATPWDNFRGFDGGQFYVVRSGNLVARYQGKTIYTLEEGDILLPDITGTGDEDIAVFYGSESGATLDAYPALDFMRRVFEEPSATRLWTRLLITYAGMMLRITAARTGEDLTATPGFEVYEPGDIIIRQGERADGTHDFFFGRLGQEGHGYSVIDRSVRVKFLRETDGRTMTDDSLGR